MSTLLWSLESLLKLAIVRVLLILLRAGDEGMSTLKLLEKLKLKSSNYGQRMINLGHKKGYIERANVKVPQGKKGNVFVINRLTAKGKQKVSKLRIRRWLELALGLLLAP